MGGRRSHHRGSLRHRRQAPRLRPCHRFRVTSRPRILAQLGSRRIFSAHPRHRVSSHHCRHDNFLVGNRQSPARLPARQPVQWLGFCARPGAPDVRPVGRPHPRRHYRPHHRRGHFPRSHSPRVSWSLETMDRHHRLSGTLCADALQSRADACRPRARPRTRLDLCPHPLARPLHARPRGQ